MLPVTFDHQAAIHCPFCGVKLWNNKVLAAHLNSHHGFGRARSFTLSNLLYLDCTSAIKAEQQEDTNKICEQWDISASQARGRDVRSKTV